MRINNPVTVDSIKEANGANMRCKLLDIGDWNMDTTTNKDVAHGLSFARIRSIKVLIRNDTDTFYYDVPWAQLLGDMETRCWVSGVSVDIYRNTGGYFDSALFDATSYNRGWIYIWYID